MEVNEVRRRVEAVYKSFSSYRDEGLCKRDNYGAKKDIWFRTFFIRPNRLRFEWGEEKDETDKFVLTVNGDKGQLQGDKKFSQIVGGSWPKPVDPTGVLSSHMPISGAAGITFGFTDITLPLLVEDRKRPCFLYHKLGLLRDEDVDGEPCFQLFDTGDIARVWVSKNDFTIRRGYRCITNPIDSVLTKVTSAYAPLSEILPTWAKSKGPQADYAKGLTNDCYFQKIEYNGSNLDDFPDFELKQ